MTETIRAEFVIDRPSTEQRVTISRGLSDLDCVKARYEDLWEGPKLVGTRLTFEFMLLSMPTDSGRDAAVAKLRRSVRWLLEKEAQVHIIGVDRYLVGL